MDQIIENLRAKSKVGKMWDVAAKARQESEASMAKEAKEKEAVNDVVKKVLQDTVKPVKTPFDKKKTDKEGDSLEKSAKAVLKKAKKAEK